MRIDGFIPKPEGCCVTKLRWYLLFDFFVVVGNFVVDSPGPVVEESGDVFFIRMTCSRMVVLSIFFLSRAWEMPEKESVSRFKLSIVLFITPILFIIVLFINVGGNDGTSEFYSASIFYSAPTNPSMFKLTGCWLICAGICELGLRSMGEVAP